MTRSHSLRAAMLAAAPLLLQACATKGYVRDHIASSRLQSDSAYASALATERDARMSGDTENASRIAALRTDLDSMRTQFNARIAVVEDGIRFALPVTFAFDDASVTGNNTALLERFATVAKKYYPDSKITVEGFADPAGSARYNLALSQKRADNVKAQLSSLGVNASQVRAVGYGKTRLIAPGATHSEPGAMQNRRVVFVIETGAAEAGMVASLPE